MHFYALSLIKDARSLRFLSIIKGEIMKRVELMPSFLAWTNCFLFSSNSHPLLWTKVPRLCLWGHQPMSMLILIVLMAGIPFYTSLEFFMIPQAFVKKGLGAGSHFGKNAYCLEGTPKPPGHLRSSRHVGGGFVVFFPLNSNAEVV